MNNTLSKSARRRLRLKQRAIQQAVSQQTNNYSVPQPQQQQPNQNRSGGRRRRRNRNRRGRNSNGGNPRNGYLDTLLFPERCDGCKVPDLVTFPSSTVHTRLTFDLDAGVGGNAAALLFCPKIGSSGGVFPEAPVRIFLGTSSGSLASESPRNWPNVGQMRGLYGSYRPVSASVTLQYTGDTQTDGGIVIGTLFPRDVFDEPAADFSSFAAWQNLGGVSTYRLKDGLRITWKPQDNADFEYVDISPGEVDPGQFPCIGMAVSRSAQFVGVVRVEIHCNFEVTSTTSTLNYDQSSTFGAGQSNLAMLEGAINFIGQLGSNAMPLTEIDPYMRSWFSAPNVAAAAGLATSLIPMYNTGRRLLM